MNTNLTRISRLFLLFTILHGTASGQYSDDYVETYSTNVGGETYSVVKMSREDNRVKVKYFAGKDFNGTSVYQRFQEWSRSKNIVAYSSGTYMTACESSWAKPVGICIDNGVLVNNTLQNNLDGLAIVYATGGMVASNLKDGDLTVTGADNVKKTLNLKNAFNRTEFIKWARENGATVFQTHLFYYKNEFKVYPDGSKERRERRFLAVGTDEDGIIRHFIVNLSGANTLYEATQKVTKFLKKTDDMDDITFLINLDTGCQDVFEVRKPNGRINYTEGFSGTEPITKATNLIVYYYE